MIKTELKRTTMKRPDKNDFKIEVPDLNYEGDKIEQVGIKLLWTEPKKMDYIKAQDKYIDYLEPQLSKERQRRVAAEKVMEWVKAPQGKDWHKYIAAKKKWQKLK